MALELTMEEQSRYARHFALPEVGEDGQTKLKAASVLIVGAGGLGSPCALYLAAAGVGRIGLIDFDLVDASNLQRQILYGESDIGKPKTERAKARLQDVNSQVQIETHTEKLTSANALELFKKYDVIVDSSDNFPTRYLVNDAAILTKTPVVHASVYRFEGQASVFNYNDGPCYRCLLPTPPASGSIPSCAEAGVLGVLPGIMGSIQAAEAIKIILGIGETLSGRLLLFDSLTMQFRELKLNKREGCAVCSPGAKVELIDYEAFCNPVEPTLGKKDSFHIKPEELKQKLDAGENIQLLDVREDFERKLCKLPNDVWIPMVHIIDRAKELDKSKTIVAYCHSGQRSAEVAAYLKSEGYNAQNLAGGIDAWAQRVELGMARY